MINWKVRIRNRSFWIALIPAVLICLQSIAAVFGFSIDLGTLGDRLLSVVNSIFVVLAILGIVADPTTEGIGDSLTAMLYDKPKPYGAELDYIDMDDIDDFDGAHIITDDLDPDDDDYEQLTIDGMDDDEL